MYSDDLLFHLIGRIYDSVSDPAGWTAFLHDLSDAFRGHMAVLFTQDFRTDDVPFLVGVRADPDFTRSCQDCYALVNLWTWRKGQRPAGGAVTDQMLATDAELRRSAWYKDWLRPQGLYHRLGGIVLRRGDRVSRLSVLRPRTADDFGEEDIALCRALFGHLARAIELQERIGGLADAKQTAEDALHRLPAGVVTLDEAARVVFANRAGEAILSAGDGLALVDGALCATRTDDDRALKRLIGEAIATGLGSGGTLSVPRPSGKRPYAVTVSPAARHAAMFGDSRPVATLFLTDPEAAPALPRDALRRLYGLTAREGELAAALAAGARVEDAAECLGIAAATARTYLKRILDKTDTHSQAQLVALLLRTVPFEGTE
jgi:DNA-binding CsgD family transcriptional regulator